MIDTQEPTRGDRPSVEAIQHPIPTGKETPNHGLSVQGVPQNTQDIPPETVQLRIQHIAGEIAHLLVDGQPQMCYRVRNDTDWRVRVTPPNNPALRGDAERPTPPLSVVRGSGNVRDTSATEGK